MRQSPAGAAIVLTHRMLVLDAWLCRALDQRRHRAITRDFVDDLLRVLGMEPLGELGIFPAVDERAPGWSFIQPITTSHVSAHYFERPGPAPHLRLDAYSCHPFDWRRLIGVCHRHFRLADWRASLIEREIDAGAGRSVMELSGTGPEAVSHVRLLPDGAGPTGGVPQAAEGRPQGAL